MTNNLATKKELNHQINLWIEQRNEAAYNLFRLGQKAELKRLEHAEARIATLREAFKAL